MRLIEEARARSLVNLSHAIDVVEAVFKDLSCGEARLLPVVREPLGNAMGTFGVKSGELDRYSIVGLKAGGYWPANESAGIDLTNHQSATMLFDCRTGEPIVAVEANWLTQARTAAIGAIAIKHLSREDSKVLGIIGTGTQAPTQIEAALLVRDFDRVLVYGRSEDAAKKLAVNLARPGIEILSGNLEETVRESDVLITVTSSNEALFPAEWVPAGQHINAMGADTKGKQELHVDIVQHARLFFDDWVQSTTIGEFQHAVSTGCLRDRKLGEAIGDVLSGKADGRKSRDEITVFDSTGIGLQDLAVAWLAYSFEQQQ